MSIPVIHLIEQLRIGGDTGVMQGLTRPGGAVCFRPMMAGLAGDSCYLETLCATGHEAAILDASLQGLSAWIDGATAFVVMIHRAGSGSACWQRILPELRARGAKVILAWNHFSEVDTSDTQPLIDSFCFGSRDSLWRHWIASGSPDPTDYLAKHRVLHCPIRTLPTPAAVRHAGAALRTRLGIEQDAFVVGDICRPAPEKLDWMFVEVFRQLRRRIPNAVALTRRYPDAAAKALLQIAPHAAHNLPMTSNIEEMAATYGALDVMAHTTTMGESFGMAIGEALACGVPVITNETPSLRCDNAQGELVADQQTGYIANDPQTFLDRLLLLAEDIQTRQRLGENGIQQMQTPPYQPESIRARLDHEIVRLAAAKEWCIPEAPTQPADDSCQKDMEAYLQEHTRCFTSKPQTPSRIWTWRAHARRFWWRIRRRWR